MIGSLTASRSSTDSFGNAEKSTAYPAPDFSHDEITIKDVPRDGGALLSWAGAPLPSVLTYHLLCGTNVGRVSLNDMLLLLLLEAILRVAVVVVAVLLLLVVLLLLLLLLIIRRVVGVAVLLLLVLVLVRVVLWRILSFCGLSLVSVSNFVQLCCQKHSTLVWYVSQPEYIVTRRFNNLTALRTFTTLVVLPKVHQSTLSRYSSDHLCCIWGAPGV